MNNSPIRIGYSLSLTSPVAENTKSARLAHQVWEQDVLASIILIRKFHRNK